MLEFIFADANIPFAIAIALMLIIGLFEGLGTLVGVGFGNMLDSLVPDYDINPEFDMADAGSNNALSRLLGWLRVGKVPLLMLLVTLLIAFGCLGLGINLLAGNLLGFYLPLWLSVPVAFLAALPATRVGAKILEFILPKDETSAVSLDNLIGREAKITLGAATSDKAAEARVTDQHGTSHYILVKAEQGHGPFTTETPLLLVRRTDSTFIVIASAQS